MYWTNMIARPSKSRQPHGGSFSRSPRKLADNALVALTLMIAESKPDEKNMMTKVVVSLINAHN